MGKAALYVSSPLYQSSQQPNDEGTIFLISKMRKLRPEFQSVSNVTQLDLSSNHCSATFWLESLFSQPGYKVTLLWSIKRRKECYSFLGSHLLLALVRIVILLFLSPVCWNQQQTKTFDWSEQILKTSFHEKQNYALICMLPHAVA